MKGLLFTFVIFISLVVISCGNKTVRGNGKVISQNRSIKGIKEIAIAGAYEVYLKKDSIESLVIETDENLMEYIKAETKDSILNIYNTKTILRSNNLKLVISAPALQSINFSGAAELSGDTGLIYKKLYMTISGAGKIDLALNAELVNANVSGGAAISFRGRTRLLSVALAGTGNLDAFEMQSDTCSIDISGLGIAKINVSKQLNVNISGYGKVEYKGSPEIRQTIAGAGKVSKRD